MITERRATIAMVAGLTALGAALRVPGLDTGLWFDEIVTLIESVRLPTYQLVTTFPGNNNHPLYSLLAHASVEAFGDHAWTLRLPAFVFGVASIPVLYMLAGTLTSRGEALLATLLMTVAYHAVWFAQNARGYTVLLFCTLLATWLFIAAARRPLWMPALSYGVVVGLGIYTHLTMVFVAAAHAVIWGARISTRSGADQRRDLSGAVVAFVSAALVSGLLYLPMAAAVYRFFSGPPQETASVATSKWAVFEMLWGLRIGFGTFGVLGVLVLIAVGGLSYLRRDPFVALLFALPGVLTAAGLVVMRAPIRPRFFFFLLGFGLLMLVRGAVEVEQWLRRAVWPKTGAVQTSGTAIAGLLTVLSLWSLRHDYRYPKQDFAGALAFVEQHRRESEPIATSGLAIYPYERYYQRPWAPIVKVEQFDRLRTHHARAWLVYSFPEYMDHDLVSKIQQHCTTLRTFPGTVGGGDLIVCTTSGPSHQ